MKTTTPNTISPKSWVSKAVQASLAVATCAVLLVTITPKADAALLANGGFCVEALNVDGGQTAIHGAPDCAGLEEGDAGSTPVVEAPAEQIPLAKNQVFGGKQPHALDGDPTTFDFNWTFGQGAEQHWENPTFEYAWAEFPDGIPGRIVAHSLGSLGEHSEAVMETTKVAAPINGPWPASMNHNQGYVYHTTIKTTVPPVQDGKRYGWVVRVVEGERDYNLPGQDPKLGGARDDDPFTQRLSDWVGATFYILPSGDAQQTSVIGYTSY